jgi:uncharacterized tellurite resistance protein B-like protein
MNTYAKQVTTQDQALCHLLFHCCLKDGRFDENEIDKVSEIFVEFGLQHDLNFKNEVRNYRSYALEITDEQAYIDHLVQLIVPANELALFSWCLELTLSDSNLSLEEESMLDKIAASLQISTEEKEVIKKLMIQRSVVLSEKIC